MCNISQGIRETAMNRGRMEGLAEGRTQGRAEGMLELMVSLVNDGIVTVAEACKRLNISEAELNKALLHN